MVHFNFSVLSSSWWRYNGRTKFFTHKRNSYRVEHYLRQLKVSITSTKSYQLHQLKVWEWLAHNVYSILKRKYLEYLFLWRRKAIENQRFLTLCWNEITERPVLVHRIFSNKPRGSNKRRPLISAALLGAQIKIIASL